MLCFPWKKSRGISGQWQSSGRYRTQRRNTDMEDDGPSHSEVSEPPITAGNFISLHLTHDACDGGHDIPPIFAAIQSGDGDTVKSLLQETPNLANSSRCGGLAPLHAVVHIQNPQILTLLLDYRADVHARDDHGHTALHLAVQVNWHRGMEELLLFGASPDAQCEPPPSEDTTRETPFHSAVRLGDFEAVQLMLSYKPDLSMLDSKGCSVLHLAARVHSLQIIQQLLQEKAVQEVVDNRDCEGNSALHTALIANHGFVEEAILFEVARVFFEAGVDVSASNSNGECALYLAARFGLPRLVELLLFMGADPTCVTLKGKSVLHAACYRGSAESLDLLLKTGKLAHFITSADKSGCEPFHYAVYSGSIDCCEMLFRNGDHLTRKDEDGVTRAALIIAYLPSAKELLSRVFDSSITISHKVRRDPECHIIFDYSVILPVGPDTQSAIITELNAGEAESLLKHPLLESFLCKKWNNIKFFFYGNVLAFFVFLVMHTVYINFFFHEQQEGLVHNRVFRSLYICSYLFVLVPEFLNLCAHPKKFFTSWESITKSVSLSSAGIIVFSFLRFKNEETVSFLEQLKEQERYSFFRDVSAVSMFSSWAEFMMLLGRFPALGTFILMFSRIAKSLVYFILAFSSLLIGFSMSFRVLFTENEHFKSFVPSLVRTLTMLIGELDYGDLVGEASPLISYVLLALFLFLVCVLMANLLIGLAVDDISKLQTLGRISRLSKQASYIITYERLCRFAIKTQLFPFRSAEKLDKICRLKPRCSVYLNRKRSGMFQRRSLPFETVEAAVVIGHATLASTEAEAAAKAAQAAEKATAVACKLQEEGKGAPSVASATSVMHLNRKISKIQEEFMYPPSAASATPMHLNRKVSTITHM